MRCYLVMVHGVFDYHVKPLASGLDLAGFYAGRSVLARDQQDAVQRAFAKVDKGLARWSSDIRDGLVSVRLEADDVEPVPLWYVLRRSNRGHAFYA
jgi:hypothetical protein